MSRPLFTARVQVGHPSEAPAIMVVQDPLDGMLLRLESHDARFLAEVLLKAADEADAIEGAGADDEDDG